MSKKNKRVKPQLDENARNQKALTSVFWVMPFVFLAIGLVSILLMVFQIIPNGVGEAVVFGASGIVDAAMILISLCELIWTLINDGAWRKFGLICCFVLFIGLTVYASYLWNVLFEKMKEFSAFAVQNGEPDERNILFLLIGAAQLLRYLAFAGSVLICYTGSRGEPSAA